MNKKTLIIFIMLCYLVQTGCATSKSPDLADQIEAIQPKLPALITLMDGRQYTLVDYFIRDEALIGYVEQGESIVPQQFLLTKIRSINNHQLQRPSTTAITKSILVGGGIFGCVLLMLMLLDGIASSIGGNIGASG